ncbi:hypothetical protein GCM10007298_33480 [Williamsia phyllosphaerae]|uniref:Uncharacterized protein n=1 Tax=Williamsia phyllosphaerae TaxID=885042 RepID=A0ABQ1V468_9NOCA|nr:hypothetical protein GCM10007298_33480 [Williamsia phyllosphaerae]
MSRVLPALGVIGDAGSRFAKDPSVWFGEDAMCGAIASGEAPNARPAGTPVAARPEVKAPTVLVAALAASFRITLVTVLTMGRRSDHGFGPPTRESSRREPG